MAARSSTTRQRPGRQARPGDFTGQKSEDLAREHNEEIKAREGEISMLAAASKEARDSEVIDPFDRTVTDTDTGAVRKIDDEDDKPVLIGSSATTIEVEELPEDKPKETSSRVKRTPEEEQSYQLEKVIITMACDVENVTLGHGNHFDLLEGRKYKLPRWAAQHLVEKGVTWEREV